VFWFGRFTYYRRGERERKGGATGEQGASSRRRQQELQYRTEQRQEGGSYAKPERESSEGQDIAIRILQQRKREEREEG
jgi:hypothetical protein